MRNIFLSSLSKLSFALRVGKKNILFAVFLLLISVLPLNYSLKAQQQSLPDLKIKSIELNNSYGDLRVFAFNAGKGTIKEGTTFEVEINVEENGQEIYKTFLTRTEPAIVQAEESLTFSAPLKTLNIVQYKKYTIKANIDPQNQIDEEDEQNNTKAAEVSYSPALDISLKSIDWETNEEGKMFAIEISNEGLGFIPKGTSLEILYYIDSDKTNQKTSNYTFKQDFLSRETIKTTLPVSDLKIKPNTPFVLTVFLDPNRKLDAIGYGERDAGDSMTNNKLSSSPLTYAGKEESPSPSASASNEPSPSSSTSPSSTKLPDLELTELYVQQGAINITGKNVGNAVLDGNVEVAVVIFDEQEHIVETWTSNADYSNKGLKADDYVYFSAQITNFKDLKKEVVYGIKAILDPQDIIKEKDETNNEKKLLDTVLIGGEKKEKPNEKMETATDVLKKDLPKDKEAEKIKKYQELIVAALKWAEYAQMRNEANNKDLCELATKDEIKVLGEIKEILIALLKEFGDKDNIKTLIEEISDKIKETRDFCANKFKEGISPSPTSSPVSATQEKISKLVNGTEKIDNSIASLKQKREAADASKETCVAALGEEQTETAKLIKIYEKVIELYKSEGKNDEAAIYQKKIDDLKAETEKNKTYCETKTYASPSISPVPSSSSAPASPPALDDKTREKISELLNETENPGNAIAAKKTKRTANESSKKTCEDALKEELVEMAKLIKLYEKVVELYTKVPGYENETAFYQKEIEKLKLEAENIKNYCDTKDYEVAVTKPDLVVKDIKWNESGLSLVAVIENIGEESTKGFNMGFYINNQFKQYVRVESGLAIKESKEIVSAPIKNWSKPEEGKEYSIVAEIDTDDEVKEGVETNNSLSKNLNYDPASFTAKKEIDLAAKGLKWSSDKRKLIFVFENRGNIDSGEFEVKHTFAYKGVPTSDFVTIANLVAKKSMEITSEDLEKTYGIPPQGTFDVLYDLDPRKVVTEADEDNNQAEGSRYVFDPLPSSPPESPEKANWTKDAEVLSSRSKVMTLANSLAAASLTRGMTPDQKLCYEAALVEFEALKNIQTEILKLIDKAKALNYKEKEIELAELSQQVDNHRSVIENYCANGFGTSAVETPSSTTPEQDEKNLQEMLKKMIDKLAEFNNYATELKDSATSYGRCFAIFRNEVRILWGDLNELITDIINLSKKIGKNDVSYYTDLREELNAKYNSLTAVCENKDKEEAANLALTALETDNLKKELADNKKALEDAAKREEELKKAKEDAEKARAALQESMRAQNQYEFNMQLLKQAEEQTKKYKEKEIDHISSLVSELIDKQKQEKALACKDDSTSEKCKLAEKTLNESLDRLNLLTNSKKELELTQKLQELTDQLAKTKSVIDQAKIKNEILTIKDQNQRTKDVMRALENKKDKEKLSPEEMSQIINQYFPEIDPALWYAPYIARFYKAGCIDAGKANPNGSISRAEVAKFLVCLREGKDFKANLDKLVFSSAFNDVDKDIWFFPYVMHAFNKGWIEGIKTEDSPYFRIFAPGKNINRAETVKLLAQTYGFTCRFKASKNIFSDIDTEAWYSPCLNFAYINKVTQGYKDGKFKPDQAINYAEFLKMLDRMEELLIILQ